jgi:hypothetical protein
MYLQNQLRYGGHGSKKPAAGGVALSALIRPR